MSASAGLLVGTIISSPAPLQNETRSFFRYCRQSSSVVPRRKHSSVVSLARERRSFSIDCPFPRSFPVSRRVQVLYLKRFVFRRFKVTRSFSHLQDRLERIGRPLAEAGVPAGEESSSEEESSAIIGAGQLTSSEASFVFSRGPLFAPDNWHFGRPFSGRKFDGQGGIDRKLTNRMAGMRTRASTSSLQELSHVRAPAHPPGHVGLTPSDLLSVPYPDSCSSEDDVASPTWRADILNHSERVSETKAAGYAPTTEQFLREKLHSEGLSDRELLERSLAGPTAEELTPQLLKMRLGSAKVGGNTKNVTSHPLSKLAVAGGQTERGASRTDVGVPVYVMLPLDTVSPEGTLHNPRALSVAMQALQSAGVTGVMVDVWWGVVERRGPRIYDWAPYQEVLRLVKKAGLQLQAVMSFHACGGNVGDDVRIPLPPWVHEVALSDPDIFYTDKAGHRNGECISLFSDTEECLWGRTPIQVYTEFMIGFRDAMGEDFGTVVTEVAIGMGPCGELRYPSYPEGDGRWRFPGVGEFQCYDRRALADLRRAAQSRGQPVWGYTGPHDAGHYNSRPNETGFFAPHNGSWSTPYGQFFLQWYSGSLVTHGERMLQAAHEAFYKSPINMEGTQEMAGSNNKIFSALSNSESARENWQVRVSLKCAGIHWWYCSASHAAELTAGYNNPRGKNGYGAIIDLCQQYGADFNFTCVEMRNTEQPLEAYCGPEELLNQVRVYAAQNGVPLAGENALARLDQEAYDQMVSNACSTSVTLNEIDEWGNVKTVEHQVPIMEALTFLRLTPQLFEERNFALFLAFVRRMRQGANEHYPDRHLYRPSQGHYINHAYNFIGRR